MSIKDETLARAAAEGWAHAQTVRIARSAFEGQPCRTEGQRFERGTFLAHAQRVADAEDSTLGTVVWEYAAGQR